jgi:ABC-type proline/glycine betaine transport system substrate-binding protein
VKTFVALVVALGLAASVTAPAFAAETPKDKASCEKAKMKWDDATKKCSK